MLVPGLQATEEGEGVSEKATCPVCDYHSSALWRGEGCPRCAAKEQIEAEARQHLADYMLLDQQVIINAGTAYVVAALPQQPLPSNGVSLPGIKAAVASYLKEVEVIPAAPQAEDAEAMETAIANVRDDPPNDTEPLELTGSERFGFEKGWQAARAYYLQRLHTLIERGRPQP